LAELSHMIHLGMQQQRAGGGRGGDWLGSHHISIFRGSVWHIQLLSEAFNMSCPAVSWVGRSRSEMVGGYLVIKRIGT
jgi:hypothetical protein